LSLREHGVDAHAFGPGWAGAPAEAGNGAASGLSRPIAEALRLVKWTAQGRDPVRVVRDRLEWNRLRARHPGALHGPVDDEQYVRLYSESRVSVGFVVVGDTHRLRTPKHQVRLREFEAPMAGAFYLTGWFDELEEFYEIGREIACYRSHDELVDRCRYYLAHEDERERIRRAGLARAQRDHTWQRRFEGFFAAFARLQRVTS
jgi:Glycosyl transferases group 1